MGKRKRNKRLSYSDCSAEYWRAKADLGTIEAVLVSPGAMKKRIKTWERFATTPHAFPANRPKEEERHDRTEPTDEGR